MWEPLLRVMMLGSLLSTAAGSTNVVGGCPAGFVVHAAGYWQNGIPGPPTKPTPPLDHANNTPALCAAKCQTWNQSHSGSSCVAFELNRPIADTNASDCYVFPYPPQMPFTADSQPGITTCMVKDYQPPPPPPPPPQRGRTHGHKFPRLSNIWGDDPVSACRKGLPDFSPPAQVTFSE